MHTSYRSMTARERRELEALIAPSTMALRAGLFVLVVVVLGWMLRGVQSWIGVAVGFPITLPFWLALTLAFAAFLYVRSGRWTGGRELRSQVRRDLGRGEVSQHRVRVVEALEAPEVEDEGPVFFVLDEDGTTLFFAGQEIARYKGRGFPWSEFEIHETPESRRFLRIKALSGSVPNVEMRAPLSLSEARELGVMSRVFGTIQKGLDELRKRG